MMHGGMKAIIGASTWLLCALAGIHMGLLALGYDVFVNIFIPMNLGVLILPIYYLMGIAGVISLVLFIMSCMDGCGCGSSCKCKK